MPEITFWCLERINHFPLGQLTLPSGPLALIALCVLGFGFPNFSSYSEVFSEVFTNNVFFLYFLPFDSEDFLGLVRKCLSSIFPVFSF